MKNVQHHMLVPKTKQNNNNKRIPLQLSLPRVHAEAMTMYPEKKQHIKLSESCSNTEDILLPNVEAI